MEKESIVQYQAEMKFLTRLFFTFESHHFSTVLKNWNEFVSERTKVFDQTWESVKHGMGGNNPNVALNTVMQDTDRLLNRSRAKKSFAGLRIGEDESKKTDSEQYDDTGLYQCKI